MHEAAMPSGSVSESLRLVMEIPEPALEVEAGDGEVAGEKAQMRGWLSQQGQEAHPDLRCGWRALTCSNSPTSLP